MAQKKLLKLHDPSIYCYTICGMIFAIAEEKDFPWLFSNYTQIMYHRDWQMFIFEDQYKGIDRYPFIEVDSVKMDDNLGVPFCDAVMSCLDRDYYVYLFLDRKVLFPETAKRHLAHTTLISGYDLEKKVFYLSDNYDDGRFVTLEIDMDTVREAFSSAWTASVGNVEDNDNSAAFDYLRYVTLCKYHEHVSTDFDKREFCRQLRALLNSESIFLFSTNASKYYGLASYDLLIDALRGSGEIALKRKNFHLLYEHKLLMKLRIAYLTEHGILPADQGYAEKAAGISDAFLSIRGLYMKSRLTEGAVREKHVEKLCKKISDAREAERAFYTAVLNELEASD